MQTLIHTTRSPRQACQTVACQPLLQRKFDPQKQQGAVLLLGLIMLVVFSVLSVSAAQSGMLNERVAANHYRNEATFQLAESAAPYALTQNSWINQAVSRVDEDNNVVGAFDVPVENNTDSLTVTLQADRVPMPGYSLLIDSGSRFLQVTTASTASMDNGTPTQVVQGFVRAGAG